MHEKPKFSVLTITGVRCWEEGPATESESNKALEIEEKVHYFFEIFVLQYMI